MEGHESPVSIGQKGTCTICENNTVYGPKWLVEIMRFSSKSYC